MVPEVTLEICPVTGQKDPSNREFYETSKMEWGAHLNNIVLSGLWSSNESQLYVNVLELKA